MITLTSSTFDQALTGNALVFFHRLKGCPNCDKMLPHFESFKKEGVTVYDIDVDTERELTARYAPMNQWNLPLIVYFENGQVVNMKTGVQNIMDMTKTLSNISDEELESLFLDGVIEQSKVQKQLFEIDIHLKKIHAERQRRMQPEVEIPKTASITSVPLAIDDFTLGESTAAEPEICESCQ